MRIVHSMATGTQTYSVPDMTCRHCAAAVSEAAGAAPGVESVSVDLDTKLVRVSGPAADPDVVAAAIRNAGYEPASP